MQNDQWARKTPDEMGDYWYWDGDDEHRPVHLDVSLQCKDGLFALSVEYPDGINISELDGWWCPAKYPPIPTILVTNHPPGHSFRHPQTEDDMQNGVGHECGQRAAVVGRLPPPTTQPRS